MSQGDMLNMAVSAAAVARWMEEAGRIIEASAALRQRIDRRLAKGVRDWTDAPLPMLGVGRDLAE
jgi:hypothetical protein